MYPSLEKAKRKKEIMDMVDDKYDILVKDGLIEDDLSHIFDEELKIHVRVVYSKQYWKKVLSFYNEQEILAILSLPQPGNWNRYLYQAAKERKIELINEIAEQVLLNE